MVCGVLVGREGYVRVWGLKWFGGLFRLMFLVFYRGFK